MPTTPPPTELCENCARPLTAEEIHYYGINGHGGRCEACEQLWLDRMGAWMRHEIDEPEMDAMFTVRRR